MDAEWSRVSAAFDEMCDLEPAQREARLQELESGDPSLASALRALLAADATERGALAAGPLALAGDELASDIAADEARVAAAGAVTAGTLLGSWRLVARLGEGGMGEVWAADRADGAFEQSVAIKLLRRGMETEGLLRRFLRERQILARLVHPGIARLLDAGSTADGRPYFVIERVAGEPITAWAAARNLSLEGRLRLVLAICEAVDFAHRSLVVHRDLKPSNVLVTEAGEVKLLDFGIAKLLEREKEGTQLTELEGQALTPSYAAPEQIRGEAVTTATDVYALGVLLYELLTAKLPPRRGTVPLPSLAAEVEHETVERPSNAVRALAGGETIAGLEPARLARRLSGDLDTIVLKALAREPERRYPTATALGDDLRHYLAGRPIAARPDSASYRLGKFVRRHRAAVSAAVAVVVALVAGLTLALWQADRAKREARRAERVRDFLVSVFESRDPDVGAGRRQTVEQLVDESVGRLATELAGEPEVEADLADALARAEASLGRHARAQRLARRALLLRRERFGEDSVEVAASLTTLGVSTLAAGDALAAERLLRAAVARAEQAAGPDSIEAAGARVELASALSAQERPLEALAPARHAHGILLAALGPDDRRTLRALLRYAEAALDSGDRHQAERILRQALRGEGRQPTPLTRALLRRELADVLFNSARPVEARHEIDRALAELEALLGERHVEVVDALNVRSMVRLQAGDFEGGSEDIKRALSLLEQVDPDHPLRATLLSTLANAHLHLGQIEQALILFREILERAERSFGPDSSRAYSARTNLADALHVTGHDAEALAQIAPIVARLRREPRFGLGDLPMTVLALQSEILSRSRRVPEAIVASRFALELMAQRGAGSDPKAKRQIELALASSLIAAGTPAARREARGLLERAPQDRDSLPLDAGLPERLLAAIDAAEGKLADARRRLQSALSLSAAAGHGSNENAAETRLELGLVLESMGEHEEARRVLAEAQSLLFRRKGRDHPDTQRAAAALARLKPPSR